MRIYCNHAHAICLRKKNKNEFPKGQTKEDEWDKLRSIEGPKR